LRDPALPAVLVLLRGDYGTGKTTFVQGLAAGLGITGPTRSPSYLIVQVYGSLGRPLVHADLYRVHSPAEVDELGIGELAGDDALIAVEWPGEAGALLGGGREVIEVRFQYDELIQDGPAAVPSPTSSSRLETADVVLDPADARIITISASLPLLTEVLFATFA
jgi:tRNA threonylcarbamoyladenosine biosynthesis protein TsaE